MNIPTARNIISRYKRKTLMGLQDAGQIGENEYVPPARVEEILCESIGISLSDLRAITLSASPLHTSKATVKQEAARAILDAAKQFFSASELAGMYVQKQNFQEVDTTLHATMGGCIEESDKIRSEIDRIWETYLDYWQEKEDGE